MTGEGVVTNYHKKHLQELEIPLTVEAYIQLKVLKTTLKLFHLTTDEKPRNEMTERKH